MDTITAVRQIEDDFANQREPFDDVTFPEQRLLEVVAASDTPREQQLQYLSAFATFDYNRNATQLAENLIEVDDTYAYIFDPRMVANLTNYDHVGETEDEIAEIFSEIGFRYPNRDASAWVTNCKIIAEQYTGRWTNLLLDVSCDGPTLVARLEEDGFSCLKGDKIAPMYARIVDEHVAPLSNLWDLEIPVDTHIRSLSQDLFDNPSMSHDEIRQEWRGLAIETDIRRDVVDAGLWQIGNNWNSWGEDYWESLS